MISPARLRILDRWDRSGLSAAAFAPSAGVSAWTLYSWRRRARLAESSPGPAPPPAFVELAPRDEATDAAPRAGGAALELALPRGIVLRVAPGFDARELRRAVDALVA